MEAFAIPFLLLVGAMLSVQAAANVQLSTATGSPFGASTLQLGIGAALLLAAPARSTRSASSTAPSPGT
jgi:bacterial/archaeal transporter family-2 protein